MNDQQLLHYSRQILLPQIDIEGQQKLLDAHVLVIGAGGLGSPVCLYLAAAGVGQITLVDDDQVEQSNLQRQIVHQTNAVGLDKVTSAKRTIAQIAPQCVVNGINQRLSPAELEEQVAKANLVLDCCDNFATRFLLNRVCYQHNTTLVSGAAIRWEGQVSTYTYAQGTPCYECLYESDISTDESCLQNGVVAPLVGVIGSIQAMEAIKSICASGELLVGRLQIFDGLAMQWRSIQFKPKPNCPVCGGEKQQH
ncbi:HesA/MoeB/ThiF family protein [Aliikangiella sp. IMCC44632]